MESNDRLVGWDIHGFITIQDLRNILEDAKTRWFRPHEVCAILCSYKCFGTYPEALQLPKGGTIVLYDRKTLRSFREDGHNWKKNKDGELNVVHRLSRLYTGTTLGVSYFKGGVLLTADGFQFLDMKYTKQPLRKKTKTVDYRISDESFQNYCLTYEPTEKEVDDTLKKVAYRKKFNLERTDAIKIYLIGSGSCKELSDAACHIHVAVCGRDAVGKKIVSLLNDMAATFKSNSEVLKLKDCVTFSSNFLKRDFKPEDWDLEDGFDMSTYTCGLLFVTCEGGIPKFVYVDKLQILDNIKDFLFVGPGTPLANKVMGKHWTPEMEEGHCKTRMKEGMQAASFSTLSGGRLMFVTISIDDHQCKTTEASADLKAGNIPWSRPVAQIDDSVEAQSNDELAQSAEEPFIGPMPVVQMDESAEEPFIGPPRPLHST